MTEEDFINKLRLLINDTVRMERVIDYTMLYNQFFESNICIPRGVNIHPYADVYHRYLEDTSIKLECQRNDGIWFDTAISELHEVRIKPSEPVYEYLWYKEDGATNWMTIEEAKMTKIEWYCATETKRARQ